MTRDDLINRLTADDGELVVRFLEENGLGDLKRRKFIPGYEDAKYGGKNYIFFRDEKYFYVVYLTESSISLTIMDKHGEERSQFVYSGRILLEFYAKNLGDEYIAFCQAEFDRKQDFILHQAELLVQEAKEKTEAEISFVRGFLNKS